jgi:hypothetical protein
MQVKHLSDAPLKGRLMALPTKIRLGCQGLHSQHLFFS